MESVWSVSKLSTESVGSRHELVANYCVHTADADATQLDSFVASASAVCIGQYFRLFEIRICICIYIAHISKV